MNDPFGKSTQGIYAKPYQILNKTFNKNHWNDKIVDSHSFLLAMCQEKGHLGSWLMTGPNHPKRIPPRSQKKAKKKTTPKIRFLLV